MDSEEPSSAGGVLVACALVVFYFSTPLSTAYKIRLAVNAPIALVSAAARKLT